MCCYHLDHRMGSDQMPEDRRRDSRAFAPLPPQPPCISGERRVCLEAVTQHSGHAVSVNMESCSSIRTCVSILSSTRGAEIWASSFGSTLCEAKSAGDFTNVNKRRKEEAIKITYPVSG